MDLFPVGPARRGGSVVNGRAAGWDEGVMDMSLGEKSILTITRYVYALPTSIPDIMQNLLYPSYRIRADNLDSDYAYGDR